MENCGRKKYGKAPTDGNEIRKEFEKPEIFELLGRSLHHERGDFFNVMQIKKDHENCILSSAKSISLILENVREEDRFFLLDGTFRVTPRGHFQQVLILHFQFGIKVNMIHLILF